MPSAYTYDGKQYYISSMIFEFLSKDEERKNELKRVLVWHIKSKTHRVEKVQSSFIENLIGEDEWSQWWRQGYKTQGDDYIIESNVWHESCRNFMKGQKREKISRVL